MKIQKTTFNKIKKYRTDYFNSLPQFQELYLELMINDSNIYVLIAEETEVGYTIINSQNILIEFYVINKYIPSSNIFFRQVLNELSVNEIYCKSFDSLLLSNCMLNSFSYSILGVLFRDYAGPIMKKDTEIKMHKADLTSVDFLSAQDDSIKELFETEKQLTDFIKNENVFLFYKSNNFIGCGMVIKTHTDWDYCDLGIWVNPSHRGNSYGSQIIFNLREFAINNNLRPSCGCAIDNVASQKTIEKAGFVSKYKMICFMNK